MWTNDAINNNNDYVFPTLRKKPNWDISIENWVENWIKGNPKGKFAFWYDKNTVTPSQIEKTKSLFNKITKASGATHQIELKDVNELSIVKNQKNIFSDPRLTYIKVDLLRLLAALDYLEKCKKECAFIYADVDKGFKAASPGGALNPLPLTENNLFNSNLFQSWKTKSGDKTTPLDDLKPLGLIMREGSENSFLMLSNHQPDLLNALKKAVIEPILARAREYYIPKLDKFGQEFGINPFTVASVENNKAKIPQSRHQEVISFFKSISHDLYNAMTQGPLLSQFYNLKQQVDLKYDQQKYKNIVDAWRDIIPFLAKNGNEYITEPNPYVQAMLKGDTSGSKKYELYQMLLEIPTIEIGGSVSQINDRLSNIFK